MIRPLLLPALFLAAHLAPAAVVQGVVLDDETGNPLARATVSLIPLPGTTAGTAKLRTGERGGFSILSVRPGWYVLRASRTGFGDAESGQVRPGRPGVAFEIKSDAPLAFHQLRLRRLPAVAGTVVDDNGVGLPNWPVSVYTARKPVRRVTEGRTDDRGDFRIGTLDPGAYVVRSAAGTLEDDTALLPTWYKFGTALESAEPLRLRLGDTRRDLVIRPVAGRLLKLSGFFTSIQPANLAIVTDTGRRVVASSSGGRATPFEAAGIPPGPVEFVSEGTGCGGYNPMIAERDAVGLRLACEPVGTPIFQWRGLDAYSGIAYPVFVRRVDLDGTSAPRELKPADVLPPGRWEFTVQLPVKYYLTGISSVMSPEPATRNDGWFGLTLGNQARLIVTGSNRPVTISGTVSSAGRPVSGATVYVELFNQTTRERLQLWSIRTDPQGRFSAAGLAPGSYRLVSAFDFDPDDPLAMERATAITIKEGETPTLPLEFQP